MRLRRARENHDAAEPGGDSFLDVVTNIVGIMIVLVMVTGVRVREFTAIRGSRDAAQAEVDAAASHELGAERDLAELDARIQAVRSSIALRRQERLQLLAAAEEARAELIRSTSALNAAQRAELEAAAERERLSAEIARLQTLAAAAEESRDEVVEVSSLPTPVSQEVNGRELHFHLHGGRIAFVPIEELVQQFKQQAGDQARRRTSAVEILDEIGPIEGFRMRYRLVRSDVMSAFGGKAGSVVQLVKWEVEPERPAIGEPLDVALQSGSAFRRRLDQASPESAVATIWVYPDSFAEFRRLKQALYELGYSTAARPLPEGVLIAGSPEGTRSAAQ